MCPKNNGALTSDSVLTVRLAAMGADVDDGRSHLRLVQMAHMAPSGPLVTASLDTCRVLARVARDGRDQFSWRSADRGVFALPSEGVVRRSWKAHVRRRPVVRDGSDYSAPTSLRGRVDRDDRNRPDPSFRRFSPALMSVALRRPRGAPTDEPASGVNQPQRILGSSLEHRIQGRDASLSFSSLRIVVRTTLGNCCRIPIQWRGPRSRHLRPCSRWVWRSDSFLCDSGSGDGD